MAMKLIELIGFIEFVAPSKLASLDF